MFLADISWPGAVLAMGTLSIWPMMLGIFVELPLVAWILRAPWKASVIATLFINAFAALLGVYLIIMTTFFLEAWATFGWKASWVLAYFVTMAITIGVEVIGLLSYTETKFFENLKLSRPPLGRIWLGLSLASFLTVNIACVFLLIKAQG